MKRTIPLSEIKSRLRESYRANDDVLFNECLDNLNCIPSHAICYWRDGDAVCCVFGDFRNLQDDPAGFAATEEEALAQLGRQYKLKRLETEGDND